MDLVKAKGDVEWRGFGIGMLAGEVIKEALGREGEIANTTLQEVSREGGFRRHDKLGRLRPG
jgi:hypothetical protein